MTRLKQNLSELRYWPPIWKLTHPRDTFYHWMKVVPISRVTEQLRESAWDDIYNASNDPDSEFNRKMYGEPAGWIVFTWDEITSGYHRPHLYGFFATREEARELKTELEKWDDDIVQVLPVLDYQARQNPFAGMKIQDPYNVLDQMSAEIDDDKAKEFIDDLRSRAQENQE